jgi:hypothetical protein
MRSILFFAIGAIFYQTASGANLISSHYFQDTVKIKKVEPHKNIKPKSSSSPHKGKPVSPLKKSTNNRSKKDSARSKKSVGIDHPAPDQEKSDSIIKIKDKEKSQGK